MRRQQSKDRRKKNRGAEAEARSRAALSRMHEVFSEGVVDELRRETGYNPRQRRATAYRLLLCCVEACLFGKTLGFAAIQAFFVKRFGSIQRRAFQLRFKSSAAVRFFRAALDRVIGHAVTEFAPELTNALAMFTDVIAYDGTGQRVPRRGRKQGLRGCNEGTAGSKWVVGYSLRSGVAIEAKVGAGTDAEYPMWKELVGSKLQRNALYLLDLGYFARAIFEDAVREGAHVLMRLKADETTRNRLWIESAIEHGQACTPRRGKTVSSYLLRVNRKKLTEIDLDVRWGLGTTATSLRVVGVRVNKRWFLYLTTVPRDQMTPKTLASTYRLRWLIEFLFREWKQEADWGRSATADRDALEALTYAALITHALVRSLRVAAACRHELPLETLRPLACLHAVRAHASEIVSALGSPNLAAWHDLAERLIITIVAMAYEPRPSRSRPRIARNLGAGGG